MRTAALGESGLEISRVGVGAWAIGGGGYDWGWGSQDDEDSIAAIHRAVELGVNWIDTAAQYGFGHSEEVVGRALAGLEPRPYVFTKGGQPEGPGRTTLQSLKRDSLRRELEGSLARLGLERVDLLQCHNLVTRERTGRSVSVKDMRDAIVPALIRLVEAGKIGFYGMTALGETAALHEVLDAGIVQTAQVCFNLLNPSAAHALPPRFPAQDFGRLLDHAARRRTGVIVIRVLAAGALSGSEARHPIAVPTVDPIASAPEYAEDVRRARLLEALVKDGHADSLVEASLRFALTSPAVSTVLLGYSSLEHLEYAAASIAKGPLSAEAVERLPALWATLAER